MTTYIIGDLQGCFSCLQKLLKQIKFNLAKDKLWIVGDIVNRGPESLECLEFVYNNQDYVQIVLGNHDLHLIACYYGISTPKKSDTLTPILKSSKSEILIDWLCHQPLIHYNKEYDAAMVHAGIWPSWSLSKALKKSKKVEDILKSKETRIKFLEQMYGNEPSHPTLSKDKYDKLRFTVNSCTRMRFLTSEQHLELTTKDCNEKTDLIPWFKIKRQDKHPQTIFFGHWAALSGKTDSNKFIGLDTGCVWGGKLTAYALESKDIYQINCKKK